ncbi:hypothetical protein RRG08_004830 [Elysia crispata]|uniref:Uncharacterized protein n=1 Tax=Elysia crispata TaxID=231223 RepID=A0AAE1CT06_9GAST|nr:hypothetical protein RRG08_004830 [Elysia crispata]
MSVTISEPRLTDVEVLSKLHHTYQAGVKFFHGGKNPALVLSVTVHQLLLIGQSCVLYALQTTCIYSGSLFLTEAT